jgi:5'(3')-deoxyribonucleotidase
MDYIEHEKPESAPLLQKQNIVLIWPQKLLQLVIATDDNRYIAHSFKTNSIAL